MSSLVIQTSFLGDTILTTPLISELARRGPVDVVTTPASAPLLAGNPEVREIIVYDKRGAHAGLGGLRRIARRVRQRAGADGSATSRDVAVAYLAQQSVRSATLAVLSGAHERVGFGTAPGRFFYTRHILFRDDLHHAERLWQLAGGADARAPVERLRPRLYPGAAEEEQVERVLREGGWSGEPILAMAPGSVWGTKRWPYYPVLAQRVAATHRVVIVGGPADGDAAGAILDVVGAAAIDATGRLSLLASAALIGRAEALVTNDSSPLHLASAMATPTVAVFGPTVPEFGFGPLAPRSRVVGVESLSCRPCDRHGPQRCPLGHWRCMRELTVDHLEPLVRSALTNRVG